MIYYGADIIFFAIQLDTKKPKTQDLRPILVFVLWQKTLM